MNYRSSVSFTVYINSRFDLTSLQPQIGSAMIIDQYQSRFRTPMARRRDYNQPSLTRKYLDLVEDYLELQRLRVAVKRAEFQQLKREGISSSPCGATKSVNGSAS